MKNPDEVIPLILCKARRGARAKFRDAWGTSLTLEPVPWDSTNNIMCCAAQARIGYGTLAMTASLLWLEHKKSEERHNQAVSSSISNIMRTVQWSGGDRRNRNDSTGAVMAASQS